MAITFDSTYNSTDYSLRNRNYTILIRKNLDHKDAPQKPAVIVGSVKSEFQFNQNVNWEPFWGGPEKGTLTNILAGGGVRLVPQVSTVQIWDSGGSELELSVEFDLHAWSDPEKDVMDPLRTLMGMTNPSIDSKGFLRSPGAYIDPSQIGDVLDAATGNFASLLTKKALNDTMRGKVSISIGRWIYFDNVAVTGVQYQLHNDTPYRGTGSSVSPSIPIVHEGAATGATVTVNFKPMFMFTLEDLSNVFMKSDTLVNAQDSLINAVDLQSTASELVLNDAQMELIDLFDPLAI